MADLIWQEVVRLTLRPIYVNMHYQVKIKYNVQILHSIKKTFLNQNSLTMVKKPFHIMCILGK